MSVEAAQFGEIKHTARLKLVSIFGAVLLVAGCGGTSNAPLSPKTAAPTGLSSAQRAKLLQQVPQSLTVYIGVQPAVAGGPDGTSCQGAGRFSAVQADYKVTFTDRFGGEHYTFLGETDSGYSVQWDGNSSRCTFALLLTYVESAPFVLNIAGKSVTIPDAPGQLSKQNYAVTL